MPSCVPGMVAKSGTRKVHTTVGVFFRFSKCNGGRRSIWKSPEELGTDVSPRAVKDVSIVEWLSLTG